MNINFHKYGEGFPLVFFHGWGFDSHVWLPLVAQLRYEYQMILVDLPGFGNTPVMPWNLFKEHLLNHLPKQFAAVGWSLGGLYAQRLAIENPDNVGYLISISSSPKFLMDKLWPGVPVEVFHRFHQQLSTNYLPTLSEFLELNGLINDQFFPDKNPSPISLELGLEILETWDLREGLNHFDNTACFMFGRLDPIVPIKTMRIMEKVYPQFNYVLFNRAAHLPFLSHSDLFIEKIRALIK